MKALILLVVEKGVRDSVIDGLSHLSEVSTIQKVRGEYDVALSISSRDISGLQDTIKQSTPGVEIVSVVLPEFEAKKRVYTERRR